MSRKRKSNRPAPTPTTRALTLDEVLDEIEDLTHLIQDSNAQRDHLIGRARDLGASWHKVSLAVEMTPQGANRRWGPKP